MCKCAQCTCTLAGSQNGAQQRSNGKADEWQHCLNPSVQLHFSYTPLLDVWLDPQEPVHAFLFWGQQAVRKHINYNDTDLAEVRLMHGLQRQAAENDLVTCLAMIACLQN